MGCLLGLLLLLSAQPLATRQTYWARRWAVALHAVELAAAVDGGSWVPAALNAVIPMSDPMFAPGEVKRPPSISPSPLYPSAPTSICPSPPPPPTALKLNPAYLLPSISLAHPFHIYLPHAPKP